MDESVACMPLLNIFLYAVVLIYGESLSLKYGCVQDCRETVPITNTSQDHGPPGNMKKIVEYKKVAGEALNSHFGPVKLK